MTKDSRLRRLVAAAAILTLAWGGTVQAAKKQHQWQIGKVLDTSQASEYVGSSISDAGIFGVDARARYVGVHTYVIQVGQYIYVGQQLLRFRWSKYVNLVVNGEVTVAIENGKMYIPFADGKVAEAVIVKTILKER